MINEFFKEHPVVSVIFLMIGFVTIANILTIGDEYVEDDLEACIQVQLKLTDSISDISSIINCDSMRVDYMDDFIYFVRGFIVVGEIYETKQFSAEIVDNGLSEWAMVSVEFY